MRLFYRFFVFSDHFLILVDAMLISPITGSYEDRDCDQYIVDDGTDQLIINRLFREKLKIDVREQNRGEENRTTGDPKSGISTGNIPQHPTNETDGDSREYYGLKRKYPSLINIPMHQKD